MAEDMLRKFQDRHTPQPGRVLVVGSKCYGDKPDRRAQYAEAFGVDLFEGEGVDLVHDLEKPLRKSVGKFAHVDCVSVLEHVQRPWIMAENIDRVMDIGSTILISVPFCWRVHGYPSDLWRMTTEAMPVLFPNVSWHERLYIVADKFREAVPGMRDDDGGVWMARAEMVAFGAKCA